MGCPEGIIILYKPNQSNATGYWKNKENIEIK